MVRISAISCILASVVVAIQAASIPSGVYRIKDSYDQLITMRSRNPNERIVLLPLSKNPKRDRLNQEWHVTKADGSDQVYIRNKQTGLYLSEQLGMAKPTNAVIQSKDKHGWKLAEAGNNLSLHYYIKTSSSEDLFVSQSLLMIYPPWVDLLAKNEHFSQVWKFERINA
ncbi:hypothetical protein BGW38_002770 [Lunasporangiospora selenospora]|uniref:Ricin B lectin domain-containing protein n=1 Tax=Lunasporangiospora selenospora TaxID=979761 RepID=A0A9P6KJ16_9FUNG|nr:hypothetical protein BGW38_002770 [Lunasporangiospora selenospora]